MLSRAQPDTRNRTRPIELIPLQEILAEPMIEFLVKHEVGNFVGFVAQNALSGFIS
ncbi:hypothetical protein J4E08_18805 [Sagittula sp. NFXS13]|uniref:hypothetical protein n=1 Tax=Sagittula sp. NFXS13 TaxID=2819095 RepID=UPI0032DEF2AB